MGLLNSKQWDEMTEMQEAEKERENKEKEVSSLNEGLDSSTPNYVLLDFKSDK